MFKVNRTKKYSRLALQQGFTLIELMIVLAILSVLLFVAVPNYDSVIADSEVDKARLNLATGLALARTEAVKRGEDISLCRGTVSPCAAGVWTGSGWVVLVQDSGEIIRVDDGLNNRVNITPSCGSFITFGSGGSRLSSGSVECVFLFEDTRGANMQANLWIAASGRVRMD